MQPLVPFAALPALIQAQSGRIGHSQKIADAADFADPCLELVLRLGLRVVPRLHPRQWEFAAAYLCLLRAGVLTPGSRGISFGSGLEPLIFPVAAATAQLTVTDLYSSDSAWEAVANTDSPLDFVLTVAPPDFDRSHLAVLAMDMREIAFPDASFDYAYSISAFEHIGDDPDFLRHLKEVRRVLRPGGVYVMTTELLFGHESVRTRGNYAFAMDHLLSLFAQAGLRAEPVFDARLSERAENAARELSETLWHDRSHDRTLVMIIREFAGVMSGPGIFVLRPAEPQPVHVIGLQETIAWLHSELAQVQALRYSDWISVNPFAQLSKSRSPFCTMWGSAAGSAEPGGVVFLSAFLGFGDHPMEVLVTLLAAPEMSDPASLMVGVNSMTVPGVCSVASELAETVRIDPDQVPFAVIRFRVAARSGFSYCVYGRHGEGRLALANVSVHLRRAQA